MSSHNFFRILSFFIFPAGVFLLNMFLDVAFDLYHYIPWLDVPMHFLGGVSIAYAAFLFLRFFREKGFMEINNKVLVILIIVSLVALVAVLWEFYEFFMKIFFQLDYQPSLNDTLLDLVMGLIGGLAGALVFRKIE